MGILETMGHIRGVMSRNAVPLALSVALQLVPVPQVIAVADQCVPTCRQRHNECRIQTKGSPSCDAQLQACIQACIDKSKGKH